MPRHWTKKRGNLHNSVDDWLTSDQGNSGKNARHIHKNTHRTYLKKSKPDGEPFGQFQQITNQEKVGTRL